MNVWYIGVLCIVFVIEYYFKISFVVLIRIVFIIFIVINK